MDNFMEMILKKGKRVNVTHKRTVYIALGQVGNFTEVPGLISHRSDIDFWIVQDEKLVKTKNLFLRIVDNYPKLPDGKWDIFPYDSNQLNTLYPPVDLKNFPKELWKEIMPILKASPTIMMTEQPYNPKNSQKAFIITQELYDSAPNGDPSIPIVYDSCEYISVSPGDALFYYDYGYIPKWNLMPKILFERLYTVL